MNGREGARYGGWSGVLRAIGTPVFADDTLATFPERKLCLETTSLCHQLAQLSDNPKDLRHLLAQGRAALSYSDTGSATLRWKTSPSSRVDIVPP